MLKTSEFVLNYVLNSVWQVTVIVFVAALGSGLLKNGPARYRHVLWLTALAVCVIVPLLPSARLSQTQKSLLEPGSVISLASTTDEADQPVVNLVAKRTQVVNTTSRTTLLLTLGYGLFIVWRGIRLVRFWLRKNKLRRSATLTDLAPPVEAAARRCHAVFNLPNVQVAHSSATRVPYTIGAQSPLIVLPEAFCSADEATLLSIIGHEMAHVARRDYLSNLVCEIVAIPLSFHPLTFVIKRQIDQARELACDELVSRRLLPPKLYARSLVWAADASLRPESQAFMLSMFDGKGLEERVMRLTRSKPRLRQPVARALMLTTLVALCVSALLLSLFSFELRTQAQAALAQQPLLIPSIVNTSSTETPVVSAPQSPRETAVNISNTQEISSGEERAQAACDAGRNGDVDKIPLLISWLSDDTKTQLLRCWNSGRWSPALETFKHPSPSEQAAIALASFGRPAFLPLANQLDSANATVRRNAAWAIGELTNMPPGERDGAVPRLITLLGDSDAWVRMAAARALGELRNHTAVPKLIATVADADWRVRQLAVWALSELKDERAVVALCSVLLSDTRVEVRRGAAEALGEIRSAAALPALKQALNDPAVSDKAQSAIDEIES